MQKNKKTGVTAGAFDLCHAGHFLVFKEAKDVCDYLIVLLHDDPSVAPAEYRGKKKNVPIMSLEERMIILEGIKYVDRIITYQTEEGQITIHEQWVGMGETAGKCVAGGDRQ